MSEQYLGGFIIATPTEPTATSAPGIWTLNEAATYRKQGLWPTTSGAPTIGTATAGNASASVTFSAPSDVGSAPITNYTVISTPSSITGTGASSPITVSGLSNGTSYTFKVNAYNGAGTSAYSAASNSVTPVAPPAWLIKYYNAPCPSNTVTIGVYVDSSTNIWLGANNALGSFYTSFSASGTAGTQRQISTFNGDATTGNKVFTDSSGNFYLAGGTGSTSKGVVKINSSGTVQWAKTQNVSSSAQSTAVNGITVDSSGNTYAAMSLGQNFCCQNNRFPFLLKLNSSGAFQFGTIFKSGTSLLGSNGAMGVVLDSSGNPCVMATTRNVSLSSWVMLAAVKFDTSGSITWQRFLYGTGSSQSELGGIGIDSSNNVIIAGQYISSGVYYALIAKYNSSGTIQWQRRVTGTTEYNPGLVAVDSSSNIYVTISGNSAAGTHLLKFNSSGTLQWQRKFSITSSSFSPISMSIDNTNSNVVFSTTSGSFGFTVAYPMDGSKTGSYSVGGSTVVIAAGALTESAGNANDIAGNMTTGGATLAALNSTFPTTSTVTNTVAKTDL
jgi:hypothetical protein